MRAQDIAAVAIEHANSQEVDSVFMVLSELIAHGFGTEADRVLRETVRRAFMAGVEAVRP